MKPTLTNLKIEMENYINEIEHNTQKLLETVRDFAIEDLIAKENDKWSILEVLEHIYITDKVIYSIIAKPSDKEFYSKEIIGKNKLESILVGQIDVKLQSPDLLRPKGVFQNFTDFNIAFTSLRNSIKDDLLTRKFKIDNRIHTHFLLGDMTITDWLNFILLHTERHLIQIKKNKLRTANNSLL